MMRLIPILLLVTGCATLLDDSDIARQERPDVANLCVASLLGEDVKPLPDIEYTDEMPWHPDFGFVPGYYSPSRNLIVVQRRFNQGPILRHEIGHVYDENEAVARSLARRGGDCATFGVMR